MARIDGVPAARAGLLVRLLYRVARRMYGQVPEPAEVQAHHPGVLFNNVLFEMGNQRVLRKLDPALRDLAVYRVATEVGCSWCVDFGTMIQLRQGMNIERLRELPRYQESHAFTDVEKLAVAYADAMTAQPMAVTDELVTALRGHLDDAQLVELTFVIALENERSRFNHALGITDQGFTSGEACAVPAVVPARGATASAPASVSRD